MDLMKFISDERGVSDSVFKLALAVIIFAAIIAILVAVLNQLKGAEKASDTTTEARKVGINNTLNEASEG